MDLRTFRMLSERELKRRGFYDLKDFAGITPDRVSYHIDRTSNFGFCAVIHHKGVMITSFAPIRGGIKEICDFLVAVFPMVFNKKDGYMRQLARQTFPKLPTTEAIAEAEELYQKNYAWIDKEGEGEKAKELLTPSFLEIIGY